MSPALRIALLRWSVVVILLVEIVGGWALLYKGMVYRYGIGCQKAGQVSCVLEQDTIGSQQTWQVALGVDPTATVQVKPMRRGAPRVYLYLTSATRSVFAAEFEDSAPVASAQAAAEELNRAFSSPGPASVRLDVQPPTYRTWGTAGIFGIFVLLSLVVFRLLFKPEPGSDNASKPAPLRGAA